MIKNYVPDYMEIYKKLNYIQHYSLIPSAQARAIQHELFKYSRKIVKKMHISFKENYSITQEDSKRLEDAYAVMVKHM